MNIKLQGMWEPSRIASILEQWKPVGEDLLGPWRDDCVRRIRHQIASERAKSNEKTADWKMS